MKVLTIAGGGMRIGGLFGAEKIGTDLGVLNYNTFDYLSGDSFGALSAAMTVNNWTAKDKVDFYINTDFKSLFTNLPWIVRKSLILINPLSLEKAAKEIDKLQLKPSNRLFINAWDIELGRQVIYCEQIPNWLTLPSSTIIVEKAFSKLGYGKVITRSMALPGLLADHQKYMDGGISEHPPIRIFPKSASLLLLTLGYAGLVKPFPTDFLGRSIYAYEVKSKLYQDMCLELFKNKFVVNPKIYDIESTNFDLSKSDRQQIVDRGIQNTKMQWVEFQNQKNLLDF